MSNAQLDFSNVTQEIQSLISRRRELMLFLGSLFAAMGLYLQNVLEGKLPPSLHSMANNAFLFYSIALLVPAVIVALRVAKLHSGMMINGIFYQHILRSAGHAAPDPAKAGKLNWFGVSAQLFLLTDVLAGFSAAVLSLTLGHLLWLAILIGFLFAFVLVIAFLRFHRKAVALGQKIIATASTEAPSLEDIQRHVSRSLHDCNSDMMGTLAFVGLMLFSVLENLSGLGGAVGETDISSSVIQQHGPEAYALLLFLVSLIGLVIYLRLRISVGRFSLELDPNDQPFQPFRISDLMLGYWLLVFFQVVSVYLLISALQLAAGSLSLVIVGTCLFLALSAYPIVMILARRKLQSA